MARRIVTNGFNFRILTYMGNGVNLRPLHIGFTPQLVIIKAATAEYGVFRTAEMPQDEAAYFANSAANLTGAVDSFANRGMLLKTGATTNSNGVLYHLLAFREGNNNDFATFTYTGTGAAKTVTLGFQPDFILIKRNGASVARFKDANDVGTLSHVVTAAANENGAIDAITSSGFTLGVNSAVNNLGDTYYGYAFRAANPDIMKVGSYVGNATDNRDITGVGFQPDYVTIRSGTSGGVTWNGGLSTRTTDGSVTMLNEVAITNRIQSLLADGFQIGTSSLVNTDTETYHYIAMKAHRTRFKVE